MDRSGAVLATTVALEELGPGLWEALDLEAPLVCGAIVKYGDWLRADAVQGLALAAIGSVVDSHDTLAACATVLLKVRSCVGLR